MDERDEMVQALDAVYAKGPSAAATKQAQAKLRQALNRARGRTVYYDVVSHSRVGELYVAVSERGLIALDFGLGERNFVERVQRRTKATLVRSREECAEVMKQVREYLDGKRMAFDLPLDMTTMTAFQRQVLTAASNIPRGKWLTYGDVAKAIGRPQASRAVGQALGHNPVPIVIPCHRVLGSDGSLHGYSGGGGIQTKAWLLQLEGAQLPH
ncbi:MAG: methylated-DNA--[protein]-cysteine S-methyltransferase [Thermoflexales bacterium]|nr:methylated-DNA--[protein]-cysteine S-methyltransferase [Thermoflexales bacterium]